jgi:hypothetical protein
MSSRSAVAVLLFALLGISELDAEDALSQEQSNSSGARFRKT